MCPGMSENSSGHQAWEKQRWEREGGTGQQLSQNRDSFTRHPTAEASGAQEVMLHLHPHHFGPRPSIHLCDIMSGRSRCYWRLVGVEKKKGGLSSCWGAQWTAGPCLSTPDSVWTMNDRGGEKERDRKETRVEKKREREREIDCTSVCSRLKQGLTGGMMLQLVVTRSQFLHHTWRVSNPKVFLIPSYFFPTGKKFHRSAP